MKYNIAAGELDRRVTIQVRTDEVDEFGEQLDTWIDLHCNIPCGINIMKGNEVWTGRQDVGDLTTDFKIRYIQGITPRMRLVFEGEIYDIKRVVEITRRRGYVIQAQWKDAR